MDKLLAVSEIHQKIPPIFVLHNTIISHDT